MDLISHEYADLRPLRTRRIIHATYSEPPDRVDEVALAALRTGTAASGTVVDVGCGTGALLRRCAESGHAGRLIGVDTSIASVRATGGKGVTALQGDACALPLRTRSVDCLMARHMLYHVSDVERALREARRVLRPDGTLVVVLNMRGTTPRLARMLRACAGRVGPPLPRQALVDAEAIKPLLAAQFPRVTETPYSGHLVFRHPSPLAALAESLLGFYGLLRGTEGHRRAAALLRTEARTWFEANEGPWRDVKGWTVFAATAG
ncbi:class I SAM-dependent methyltransferase [Streptomyces fungicidicus]|uniref:class I SAM-dependent methyltransferase n=1 Tax=Streptomyces fungicidicus TaxID=68203 RepID=UPI00384F2F03